MKQYSIPAVLMLCLLAAFASLPGRAQQTARPHTNTGRQGSGEIENAAGLANFFQALSASKRGGRAEPVRIMHFGDSHIAADILTAELRHRLQAQFGDGGAGLLVPRNPMATRRRGVGSGATAGWTIEGIGNRVPGDRILGPAGISLSTSEADQRAWVSAAANHFEIYFVRLPGGGRMDVLLDGVSVIPKPLSLSARSARFDHFVYDAPTDQLHRIEIRTVGPGRVRVLGIIAEHYGAGVSYDQLGINGARAARILDWNTEALAAALAARRPDLIILAYGTNESADADWTAAGYGKTLTMLLRYLKAAAPQASILVCGPPDRSDSPLPPARLPALLAAERKAALTSGAAFWSSYAAMGGTDSMNAWVNRGLGQADHVHLTSAGYNRLADKFYQALMRAYAESR